MLSYHKKYLWELLHLDNTLNPHLLHLTDKFIVVVADNKKFIALEELGIAFRNKVVTGAVDHNYKGATWEAYILECITTTEHRGVNLNLRKLTANMIWNDKLEFVLLLLE